MKNYIILIFSLIISQGLNAQVSVKEDADVSTLMNNFIKSNKSPDKTMNGWRIQISATVDRRQLDSAKKQFQKDFPQIPVITSYETPYYKLKVGAYNHQNKAESALNLIKTKYKGAYLTRDQLKMAELGTDSE